MRRNREKMSQDTRKPRTPIDDRESLAIVTGEPSMSSQSLFQTNILYQQFLHLISYPLVPKFLFLVLCSIHFSVRLRTSSPVSRERVSFQSFSIEDRLWLHLASGSSTRRESTRQSLGFIDENRDEPCSFHRERMSERKCTREWEERTVEKNRDRHDVDV